MSQAAQARWKTITFWVLSILLGVMFLGGGVTKLIGVEMQVQNFAKWGLPDWTRPIVGLTELVAAVLIVIPKTRFWGAAILVGTMAGAALTHVVSGVDMKMVPMNIVLGGIAGFLAWVYKPGFVQRMLPGKDA